MDANRHLGFDDDERSYDCVPFILKVIAHLKARAGSSIRRLARHSMVNLQIFDH